MAGKELVCFPVAPVVWPMLTERLKTLKNREEDLIMRGFDYEDMHLNFYVST